MAARSLHALAALVAVSAATDAQESIVVAMTRAARDVDQAVARLPAARRGELRHPFDAEHRRYVDFFPGVMARQGGADLGTLDLRGRRAVHGLLRTGLSEEGYQLVGRIMSLEQLLRSAEVYTRSRAADDYGTHLFGEPGGEDPWGWKFEGHHVSLNYTLVGGQVRVTPLFLGSNPAEVRRGPLAGLRTLAPQGDLALQLVAGLDAEQRERAIDATPPTKGQIIARGGAIPPDSERGLRIGDLGDEQRGLVRRLVESTVRVVRPEIAAREMARIDSAGWDDLRFRWRGPTTPRSRHYYQLRGRALLLEFDRVVNAGEPDANHVHLIWHDPERDFGEDLLREHYEHGHDHGDGEHTHRRRGTN